MERASHNWSDAAAVLGQFVELEWQIEWHMLAAVHGDAMHAGPTPSCRTD